VNRKLSMALALVSVLALGLGAVAAAGSTSVKTKVKLTSGGPGGAEGKVTSKQPKCMRKRKVTLTNVTGPSKIIGTDKTDAHGRFNVVAPLTAGDYRASVAAKRVGDLECKFAISATVHF
jgi:hypothetical protein